MASDVDRIKRLRLVQGIKARTRTPATAIVLYRKTCMPPSTEGGIDAKTAPNLPKTPIRTRMAEAHQPARRLAQPRKYQRPVNTQLERLDPEERHHGRLVDFTGTPVSRGAGDGTPDCQPEDDRRGLHERAAEELDAHDGREDTEPEADELGVAPGQGPRRVDAGAERVVPRAAVAVGAAAPVLHAVSDQVDTHEEQEGACDEFWEDLVEEAGRNEGHGDLDPDCAE
ncbi:hypothetical protein VP1G_10847 [Cytospora mali]|uniref:Uncharacterized protein n=1 Tax=Cytospora mali TaxID=578113 RepID=A0A194UX19_CYTMA|nr:hypothetical protein VP1G_10847 [Valsa mali var. pyri (nom. inval.)]